MGMLAAEGERLRELVKRALPDHKVGNFEWIQSENAHGVRIETTQGAHLRAYFTPRGLGPDSVPKNVMCAFSTQHEGLNRPIRVPWRKGLGYKIVEAMRSGARKCAREDSEAHARAMQKAEQVAANRARMLERLRAAWQDLPLPEGYRMSTIGEGGAGILDPQLNTAVALKIEDRGEIKIFCNDRSEGPHKEFELVKIRGVRKVRRIRRLTLAALAMYRIIHEEDDE